MIEKYDFEKIKEVTRTTREIKTSGKPLITIITAYYNAEKYIFDTANSILNQTFPHFEWIIINDGSTSKETNNTLKKLQGMDSRIKIIEKENGGPAAARLHGVKNASTDLIFVLDADDLIDNTMLECGYFTMLTNPEATVAYTSIATFGDEEFLYSPKFSVEKEKKENLIAVAAFIRKDKFLEVEDYTTLPKEVHEDWYMWLYFLSKGYIFINMNFYGFMYRRLNTGRLSSINSDKAKEKISNKYISEIAKKVNNNTKFIQFPAKSEFHFDSYPKTLDISKKSINKKNSKKRILCIFPWSVLGGADLFNLNLIKKLMEDGYEITVVTTESMKYDLRQEVEKYVDEYFDLTTFLKIENWAGFISYLINSRNINLVFLSNSFYGYYVLPWLKCIHKEVVFVDYLHAEDWAWRDGSYPKDSVAISHYLDKTYTCTNHLKNIMMNTMDRRIDNIDVSYIGTNVDKFDPNITFELEEELKEKYKNKKVIVFPCRMVFLKRPLLMCKIMNKLKEKHKDYICLFIGDGPALSMCKEYVNNNNLNDYCEFIDMQRDIRVYYKVANVTVICSLTEGLTLTAYESLSMGIPVISSDVGGQKELINDSTGRIIKKYQSVENDLHNYNYSDKEINDFVSAIVDICSDKNYLKMKEYCRNIMVKNFSEDVCLSKLVSSLNDLVKDGTNVSSSLIENDKFAERYLILYNEYNKFVKSNDINNRLGLKKEIKAYLWNKKIYRKFVLNTKKTFIYKMIKK